VHVGPFGGGGVTFFVGAATVVTDGAVVFAAGARTTGAALVAGATSFCSAVTAGRGNPSAGFVGAGVATGAAAALAAGGTAACVVIPCCTSSPPPCRPFITTTATAVAAADKPASATSPSTSPDTRFRGGFASITAASCRNACGTAILGAEGCVSDPAADVVPDGSGGTCTASKYADD
jgi:hypothetical protein